MTLEALRSTLEEARTRFQLKPEEGIPSIDVIFDQTESHLNAWTTPTLRPVINATGVILHTNLGRAPLSKAALAAMQRSRR